MTKPASDPNQSAKPTAARRILREIRSYAEAIIIALLVTTFLITTVGVAGSSMAPNLYGGSGALVEALLHSDRLFVPKYETWLRRAGLLADYRRGDIIIYREPADSPYVGNRRNFIVKRVIAVAGDRVRLEQGQVFINGEALDQSFISEAGGSLGFSSMPEITVPAGQYFVLGDNRSNSVDSRIYGPIDFWSVAGKASSIIWPPMRQGQLNWQALRPPAAFQNIPSP